MSPNRKTEKLRAVIMAGGEGQRLRPFTNTIPKPLLPIGRKPVAQVIVERLRASGFTHVTMALGYGADLVRAYFRDGSQFGLSIDYFEEPVKMGTAGCLSMIKGLNRQQAILVTNGDVLTELDYRAFLDAHIHNAVPMTVATVHRESVCAYGVFDVEEGRLIRVREKPKFSYIANAGIYALSPGALAQIPQGSPYDMTDLINKLIEKGTPPAIHNIDGFWFDLATVDDFDKATEQLAGFITE